jgi:hypothetical protein
VNQGVPDPPLSLPPHHDEVSDVDEALIGHGVGMDGADDRHPGRLIVDRAQHDPAVVGVEQVEEALLDVGDNGRGDRSFGAAPDRSELVPQCHHSRDVLPCGDSGHDR